ncbi:MAG TPA: DUF4157 domain-containing protein [Candidatus Angelobacter sp.]|nr:DUF4157 domain-containing protein [Candidatus Angelobacter sp.]
MKPVTTTAVKHQHQSASARPLLNLSGRGLLDGIHPRPLAETRAGVLQRKCDCPATPLLLASPLMRVPTSGLRVNQPGDQYEQEADRVADQVIRMPESATMQRQAPNILQRKCAKCEEEKNQLQRHGTGAGPGLAPTIVHEVLSSPGQSLDAATRAFMESRFGHDFSQIWVHTDSRAADSARPVNAFAYTVGHDVIFGKNRHEPASEEGLAHELTHAIQQEGRLGRATGTALDPSLVGIPIQDADPAAEGEPPVVQRFQSASAASSGFTGMDLSPEIRRVSRGGLPVPHPITQDLEPFLGDIKRISLHTGSAADALSRSLQAEAFTTGQHIFFSDGAYDPYSQHGRHLLVHEMVHTIQQAAGPVGGHAHLGVRLSSSSDAFESQACHIANLVAPVPDSANKQSSLDGGRAISSSAATVQRFEARVHESAERVGLAAPAGPSGSAFTEEEASATYFGNWMRDMNQVFVPMLQHLGMPDEVLFSIVAYLAARKFGRVMTPEQFGFYIPAEHMDNPGGLVTVDDLRPSQPTIGASLAPPIPAPASPSALVTPQESVDPMTATVQGVNIFAVDQTGTMAYIRRSNLHLERRLDLAVQSGRTPEGLMHFGAGLHVLEDLYAHSNWIEIAVGRMLQDEQGLLPGLTGSARSVFTYSPEVNVGSSAVPARRPVLITGTFTGPDTRISISSELVGFMARPLPPPTTNAQRQSEERMIRAMLQAYDAQIRSNPQFQVAMRRLLSERGVPEPVADLVIALPMEEMYYLSTILPAIIPESWRLAIQGFIREQISSLVLQPTSRQLHAQALEAQIAGTSLMEVLRESHATALGQFSATQVREMQSIQRSGGPSVTQQRREAMAAGARREQAIQALPEPVVAGPSHSQLAKDHPDSPFFGLAFLIASEAVRRMRDALVGAWNERAGSPTMPFSFAESVFPPPAPIGSSPQQIQAANDARNLYREGVAERSRAAQESLNRGAALIGPSAQSFDLNTTRQISADRIHTVASSMRILIDVLTAAGQGNAANLLRVSAGRLDQLAVQIQNARTHPQRDAANQSLRAFRTTLLSAFTNTPSLGSAFPLTALAILDDEIAATQVAYHSEQQNVLEGYTRGTSQSHVPSLATPQGLTVATLSLPSATFSFSGGQRTANHVALIQLSRELLNHPDEGVWWKPLVRAYITTHSQQILADVEARNEGVPLFRRNAAAH